ncbi:hypothetical protein FRX31_029607 [Thalictrum thalictroides]|uniref:Uncharacterized protein n=1 Tax=Thalictrum thalictroides TaxID=46969 RepID=A0A7J6V6Q4_THATH|nr:hypothetical protein FRX31_029607 [Thalictrum thalictroides]
MDNNYDNPNSDVDSEHGGDLYGFDEIPINLTSNHIYNQFYEMYSYSLRIAIHLRTVDNVVDEVSACDVGYIYDVFIPFIQGEMVLVYVISRMPGFVFVVVGNVLSVRWYVDINGQDRLYVS